jgi:hypothetical protein
MKKLKSGLYTYKFALITKERPSFGKLAWQCHLAGAIRNFPSRNDAKQYVDAVEVHLARLVKPRNSNQLPLETFAAT